MSAAFWIRETDPPPRDGFIVIVETSQGTVHCSNRIRNLSPIHYSERHLFLGVKCKELPQSSSRLCTAQPLLTISELSLFLKSRALKRVNFSLRGEFVNWNAASFCNTFVLFCPRMKSDTEKGLAGKRHQDGTYHSSKTKIISVKN